MAEAMKDHIAIIGAGAWGTALAIQAHRAGQRAMLWARDPARAALIEHSRTNERLLPGITLPEGISITADAGQALEGAALILLVVPAQALRPVLQSLPPLPAPPAAGAGISIFELLPEAPLGIPLLAWVGGAIWLAIVVLMFK